VLGSFLSDSKRAKEKTSVDQTRFDAFTRTLATTETRRRVLGGLTAGAMALVGKRAAEAATCRETGVTCTRDAQCCDGFCGERDGRGRRRCACPPNTIPCPDGCCQTCGTGAPCLVFATSTQHNGNLGGLTGADAICAARAADAGLPGFYMAWLSDSTTSAADRLIHNPGPYRMPDGTTIATSWADLTDGAILSPIDADENGTAILEDREAWTNTNADGTLSYSDPEEGCQDWTDGTDGPSGSVGETDEADGEWTFSHSDHCQHERRLLCVQQTD
jgi:hypothetical protein